jgi:hypothetical protein
MPRITLRETITKKIEIPMETLYELIENLTLKERQQLLERVSTKKVQIKPFKKAKIEAILADFAATDLYEADFMKDLEEGLKKSSVYR